jgi:large subunit ribosomal protein LP2
MRHLAAYLLLLIGGNATPSVEDITALLATAGIDVDTERLNQLLSELEGKDIEELVALGKEKLMVGGAAAAASAGSAPAAGGAPAAGAVEKVEDKPKVEEVDALEGGMDMFGAAPGGGDY